MNRDEYLNYVIDTSLPPGERLLHCLASRGFLLEFVDGRLFLSDNSHKDDSAHLNVVLREHSIGRVDGKEAVLENSERIGELVCLFPEEQCIGSETCVWGHDWSNFRRRRHGYKVPSMMLEAYLAAYIKAINACGISTVQCCDGNHDGRNELWIMFDTVYDKALHAFIWDQCINTDQSQLHWFSMNVTTVTILLEEKYTIYHHLLMAAEFLFSNRLFFRQLKRDAVQGIGGNAESVMSTDMIIAQMLKNAAEAMNRGELAEPIS